MEHTNRIRPTEPAEWSGPVRALLGGTAEPVSELEGDAPAGSSGTLNILRTIAHHEELLGPFLGFASALALKGTLPRRSSELLALRAAWNCRSAFEWGHHVIYARAAGLTEAEIARIGATSLHEDWSEGDRALLAAADQLHAKQDIADATWELLRRDFSEAQLVELPFVVGHYTMLSMVANATGVPLEDGLPRLPAG